MFRRSGPVYMLLHTVQNKMVPDFIFTRKSESEIQDKRTHVKGNKIIEPLQGYPDP